jgi:hypothetical protein
MIKLQQHFDLRIADQVAIEKYARTRSFFYFRNIS